LTRPPPQADPARKENVAGAFSRAERRLELLNRQFHLDQQNVGLWGRINSTKDQSIRSLDWPSLRDGTLNSIPAAN
jgi:hypothetical protein